MKLLLAIGVSALFSFGFLESPKWNKYISEEYGYRIEFPESPTEEQRTLVSEIGDLEMAMVIFDASETKSDENLIYIVNCTEYPDSTISSSDPTFLEEFYRGSIDGAVESVHGKKISETKFKLDGYSGRKVRIDFQDGYAVITMKLLLADNKLYMLQTITETSKDFNKSISKFMDSFELL